MQKLTKDMEHPSTLNIQTNEEIKEVLTEIEKYYNKPVYLSYYDRISSDSPSVRVVYTKTLKEPSIGIITEISHYNFQPMTFVGIFGKFRKYIARINKFADCIEVCMLIHVDMTLEYIDDDLYYLNFENYDHIKHRKIKKQLVEYYDWQPNTLKEQRE